MPAAVATNFGSATIVICTRNRPETLRRCLGSIARFYSGCDVLIVDNGSEIGDIAQIAVAQGARYVVESVVGISRARNTGARSCTAEFVAFLDDDAVPTEAWLPNLLKEFADPRVMAVTGRVIPGEQGRDTSLAATISDYDCGSERQVVDQETAHWFERANFGGLGIGASMALRRVGIELWGGFDERIGYGTPIRGFDDHNAFFRIVQRGYRVVYTPDSVAFHPIDVSLEETLRKRVRRVRAFSGYAALLMVEYPEYRRRLLRYAAGALRGAVRDWRFTVGHPLRLSRWRAVASAIPGPLDYLAVRFQAARMNAASSGR